MYKCDKYALAYTTLFRSAVGAEARSGKRRRMMQYRVTFNGPVTGPPASMPGGPVTGPLNVTLYCIILLDRKSTRLNSSHRCISYAVFCLKKKIKQSRAKP